jgi:nicotinamide-nucleotide amidase
MKGMFERDVRPVLKSLSNGRVILSRTLLTAGQGESTVAEKLGDLMRRDRNPSVGTTAAAGLVGLRLNARFDDFQAARRQLDATDAACRAVLGNLIYGQDEQTLAGVVGELLKRNQQTVTTAESCTGGLVAKMLTDLPGSSAYFHAGWVTYSNDIKAKMLGVGERTLSEHGAVSEAVAIEMAIGARRQAQADYALAISGIAGPEGGSDEKPVGTVCIALAHADGDAARTFLFSGDRDGVRQRSAVAALEMLRLHLLGEGL